MSSNIQENRIVVQRLLLTLRGTVGSWESCSLAQDFKAMEGSFLKKPLKPERHLSSFSTWFVQSPVTFKNFLLRPKKLRLPTYYTSVIKSNRRSENQNNQRGESNIDKESWTRDQPNIIFAPQAALPLWLKPVTPRLRTQKTKKTVVNSVTTKPVIIHLHTIPIISCSQLGEQFGGFDECRLPISRDSGVTGGGYPRKQTGSDFSLQEMLAQVSMSPML